MKLHMKWSLFPPLTSLRAFEAAARNLGYSAAGRELNVSHAAIAQQVRGLETHLGLPLVTRSGRGLALTAEGALLLEHLADGFGRIFEALEMLDESQTQRPINITMTPAFAANWFIPKMEQLHSAHPEIDLMINPTAETIDLAQGGCDVAIRFGWGDWKGLESEPLVQTNYVIAGAPSLVGDNWTGGAEELTLLPWLEEAGTTEIKHWLEKLGVEKPPPKHVTSLPGSVIMQPMLDGVGVAATARALIKDHIEAGRLVVLLEETHEEPTAYHMAWRKGIQRPTLKTFIRWLRNVAKEDA